MKKFALAAVGAAGLLLSLSATALPAAAAPLPSGVAASALDDEGLVQKAWWGGGGCWRWGWHGWGWYRCGGWGPGWGWRRPGWGWRRPGWGWRRW